MSNFTDLYTTQTMSVTGTRERDVADTIRHIFPGAHMMPLVTSGKIKTPEGVLKEKKMFGKRQVYSPKYEAFVQAPLAIEFTTTTLSGTTLTLSSTTGLVAKMSLVNTANNTTCNIDTVDSTTQLTVTSYGSDSFAVSSGDKLLALSPHYEPKSSSPYILFNDPDNLLNYTYIFRHPVGISETAMQGKHYGGDRYMHIKKNNGLEALRKANNNLFFDNKPSSGESNTSGLGTSFGSCDGLVAWSQTETDFGGSMTYEAFIQDMPLDFHESVGSSDPKLMFCGYEVWSIILGWENAGQLMLKPGSYDKFGIESHKIITARGSIEVMVVDAYTRGDYNTQALICNPEKIDFVNLKNRDFQLRENIQGNSVDGREDEIYGEISICPDDAGYSIHVLKGCF